MLSPSRDVKYDRQLKDILQSSGLTDLLKLSAPDMQSKELNDRQWLIHRYPVQDEEGEVDYTCFTVEFPSQYVKRKVHEKVAEGLNEKFHWEEESRSYLGELYEEAFFSKYCKEGYELTIKKKDSDELLVKKVNKLEEFANNRQPFKETMYRPVNKKYIGVDAIYIDSDCNGLFIQTTINRRHPPLKVDNVLKQFPTISKWSLCIVHPPPTQKAFNIPLVKHKKETWDIPRYVHIVDHPNSPRI